MLSLPNEIMTIIAYLLEPRKRVKLREVCMARSKLFSNSQSWSDIRTESVREILLYASEFGRLESLKWLVRTFSLDQRDIRTNNNFAIHCSCVCGHLKTARRLVKTFNLNQGDIRSCNNYAFRGSCEYGHLEMVKWLTSAFDLNQKDARTSNNYAFRWACKNGHLKVAQWLVDKFDLTREDAKSIDNYALSWACSRDHFDVAQWLISRFSLTREDACMWDSYIVSTPEIKHNHTVRWLNDTFSIYCAKKILYFFSHAKINDDYR